MTTKKNVLTRYKKKRNFKITPEPKPKTKKKQTKQSIFVIQKHAASHLHYDFRLEVNGVLVSWAIPKGPSIDPDEKRLAIMTEDHPLDYATFEGVIPEGQYGGGTVMVWDIGTYDNLKAEYGLSMQDTLKQGKVEVRLHGKKLSGTYALIRTHLHNDERNWLFFKIKDATVQKTIKHKERSVLTNRTMNQITKEEKDKK